MHPHSIPLLPMPTVEFRVAPPPCSLFPTTILLLVQCLSVDMQI